MKAGSRTVLSEKLVAARAAVEGESAADFVEVAGAADGHRVIAVAGVERRRRAGLKRIEVKDVVEVAAVDGEPESWRRRIDGDVVIVLRCVDGHLIERRC